MVGLRGVGGRIVAKPAIDGVRRCDRSRHGGIVRMGEDGDVAAADLEAVDRELEPLRQAHEALDPRLGGVPADPWGLR